MLQEAVRRLRGWVDPEEAPGAFHLANRVLNAALELQDEHLLPRKEREYMAELLEVEAAPSRVADRRQPYPLFSLLGHPLQPGNGGAVAGHGITEHDEEASIGSRPVEQGNRPEVREIAWRPLTDELAGGTRKQRRVLGRDLVRSIPSPEAIEVMNLLAEWRAPDPWVAAHRVVPPAGPTALGADPDVRRRPRLPPRWAFGDLQGRVPGPQPVHQT